MPSAHDPFDDGLGPDPIDRGSGKEMGGDGGGGSFVDPSYDDALAILGRGDELRSPVAQMALTMGDPEAAELAERLTALCRAAGVGVGPFAALPTLGPSDDSPGASPPVQEFIAALQEAPPDQQKLAGFRQQIEQAGAGVAAALDNVCEHPAVQARLAGEELPGLDFPGL